MSHVALDPELEVLTHLLGHFGVELPLVQDAANRESTARIQLIPLLALQRHHRIDLRSATRENKARDKRNTGKQRSVAERGTIVRTMKSVARI